MSLGSTEAIVLHKQLVDQVLACTGASDIVRVDPVQSLWSGFGQILRLHLEYTTIIASNSVDTAPIETDSIESDSVKAVPIKTIIVKQVQPPSQAQHPRGWNTDVSLQRKLRSYQVETCWYEHYAGAVPDVCAIPQLYSSHTHELHTTIILEDLDARFPRRRSGLSIDDCMPCLRWLARFHAHHLGSSGDGLWPIGSYWHLQTRGDEYATMANGELKQAAHALDAKLNSCTYQSLVHGDAKVANICFSNDGNHVAMVDFQYVGRGCGMRDVAYFLGSCLSDTDCEQYADKLLAIYFAELIRHVQADDKAALESEWRALYSTAWADFHRFLAGWMPEHNKINTYMQRMTDDALARL